MIFDCGTALLENGMKVVIIFRSITENNLIGTFEHTNLGEATLGWDLDGKLHRYLRKEYGGDYDQNYNLKEMLEYGSK